MTTYSVSHQSAGKFCRWMAENFLIDYYVSGMYVVSEVASRVFKESRPKRKEKSMRLVSVGMFLCAAVMMNAAFAQNKYVGVKTCSPCHKTDKQGKQFVVWQNSKHSQAYKTLLTAKANEVAKAKGIAKPAAEAEECLSCHVISPAAGMADKGFDMKEGVQCETCHGAGSAYKNLTIMKDKTKAVAAGMTAFKDEAAIEAYCKTCHNEKSPSYKEFHFKEYWDKIKHPVPKAG